MTARSTVGWIVAESADALLGERARIASSFEPRRDVDLDEVRLDAVGIDGEARLGEARARAAARGVVVGEPLDVVVERVDAGRRDDPRLAHRAAEEVLQPPRLSHHLGRAGEQRAERAAEALREAERDGVEAAPISAASTPLAIAAFRSRAPSRWTREAELAREAARLVDLLERPDPPAARVVRVLDPDDARARRVDRRSPVRRADLLGVKRPATPGRPRMTTPEWTAGPPSS